MIEGINTEDLIHGTGEWQNMQKVIRFGFKSLVDVVTTQAQEIKMLEAKMDQVSMDVCKYVCVYVCVIV